MYPWEVHVAECGFEGCKWLGFFNAIGDIQDIKRVNADFESSTTMLEFQEWMPTMGNRPRKMQKRCNF